jgi:hypothetical protein
LVNGGLIVMVPLVVSAVFITALGGNVVFTMPVAVNAST